MKLELLLLQCPLWLFYASTIAIVVLSLAFGFHLGAQHRQQRKDEREAPVGAIVGAMLGLLAFTLAFTFGMSAATYKDRTDLLLDEVGAIKTAYLRTDFLPAPLATESRSLFRQYVDIRADVQDKPERIPQLLIDSVTIHDQLWSLAVAHAQQGNTPGTQGLVSLYIRSLNDVVALHTKRATAALQYRIPVIVWLMLFAVTVFAMTGVGYQFGMAGTKNWLVFLLLALSFSAIILVIADLDRATSGLFRVSQQPMYELLQELNSSVN